MSSGLIRLLGNKDAELGVLKREVTRLRAERDKWRVMAKKLAGAIDNYLNQEEAAETRECGECGWGEDGYVCTLCELERVSEEWWEKESSDDNRQGG